MFNNFVCYIEFNIILVFFIVFCKVLLFVLNLWKCRFFNINIFVRVLILVFVFFCCKVIKESVIVGLCKLLYVGFLNIVSLLLFKWESLIKVLIFFCINIRNIENFWYVLMVDGIENNVNLYCFWVGCLVLIDSFRYWIFFVMFDLIFW